MPSILSMPYRDVDIMQTQLAKEGLIIDSRVIGMDKFGWKYVCAIDGRTLTVTRIKKGDSFGHWETDQHLRRILRFRLFDSTIESVPESFDSSKPYRYYGLEFEEAPAKVREVVIDPSVKVIKKSAFHRCARLEKCIMGDNVEKIEERAFSRCHSLKNIRLSKALRSIEESYVFELCTSLNCLFIPANVEVVGYNIFNLCFEMRILVMPSESIILRRDPMNQRLLTNQRYFQEGMLVASEYKFQHDHLTLSRICVDPDVTAQKIQTYIQEYGTHDFFKTDDKHGLTPLHIVTCVNTLANQNAIFACYEANPRALFIPDGKGSTPLDGLWKNSNIDALVSIIEDLCVHKHQASGRIS